MTRQTSALLPRKPTRYGLTLVELLVAIMIVGMLAAVALPVIVPALDSRRIRESSRMVTAYLQGARTTAMRNGRPVGVMFERFVDPSSGTAVPEMSVVLRQVEVPAPYAGDMIDSRAILNATGELVGLGTFQPDGTPTAEDEGWRNAVRVGDSIRFNHGGHLYQITGPGNFGDYLSVAPSNTAWQLSAPLGAIVPDYLKTGVPVPYQIIRQPVKSAVQPMQLPEGVVVDLSFSGFSMAGWEMACAPIDNTDTIPVIVSFSPAGYIERVYVSVASGGGVPIPTTLVPNSPLHLLLGKRERLGADPLDTTPDGRANFRDLENLWVSIFPTTGLITSSEMADSSSVAVATAADVPNAIIAAREFARSGKGMGGR